MYEPQEECDLQCLYLPLLQYAVFWEMEGGTPFLPQ